MASRVKEAEQSPQKSKSSSGGALRLFLLASLATILLTSAVHSILLRLLVPSVPRRADPDSGVPRRRGSTTVASGTCAGGRRRTPSCTPCATPTLTSTACTSRTTSPPPTRAVSHPPPAAPEPPLRRQRAPYRIHLRHCASPDDTKSVGYEQNPLSVYYCYDSAVQEQDGELKMCIAEVG